MKITKVSAKNFRMLEDSTLELRDEISLLIGKNNSGKTSFLVLFERFYESSMKFNFDDFPISQREKILAIQNGKVDPNLSIQMTIEIEYGVGDDLKLISEFILDLDDSVNKVKILFECSIDSDRLCRDLDGMNGDKERYIKKNLSAYLVRKVYAYSDDKDLTENRGGLISKDMSQVKMLINFEIIHAKRDVASSEGGRKVLSGLTTQYFNKGSQSEAHFDPINELLIGMDKSLEESYKVFFDPFLSGARSFLNLENIKVVSNLESKEVLDNCSQVVYGDGASFLPETYNGLGHMNILYLLLAIEIRKESFNKNKCQINLLFIEEPEAHTHPQIQYIFTSKIRNILQSIDNLQTVITTHSSHIVSQCKFEDIRYFKVSPTGVVIKNFYSELKKLYGDDSSSFNFITQYLTLDACELFFASKAVFIEGLTERVLWNHFVSKYEKKHEMGEGYVPLSSQSVSLLEAGANAKAFKHFLSFLDIRTLIVTDFDTCFFKEGDSGKKGSYVSCRVDEGTHTSNATLRDYLNSPEFSNVQAFSEWFEKLKRHELEADDPSVKITYQRMDAGYHGRSFEDDFFHKNLGLIKECLPKLQGLKNVDLMDSISDAYAAVESTLDKKSKFAASLLFLALTENVAWEMPSYIEEGIEWLAH